MIDINDRHDGKDICRINIFYEPTFGTNHRHVHESHSVHHYTACCLKSIIITYDKLNVSF